MADISFKIIPYSEELLRVYKTLLPEQSPFTAWKLRDHPIGPGAAVVCYSGVGEIAGMIAFQPARFIDGTDNFIFGYQSMDVAAASNAGIPGLLLWLMRTFYDRTKPSLIYGFPNDNAAPFHFSRQLRWKRLGSAPMLWRPLRAGFILRRLGLPGLDFALPRLPRARTSVSRVARFEGAQGAAWIALRRLWTPQIAVDRSLDVLNWRFANNPVYKYDMWTKGQEALAVSRLVDKHGARIVYICELMGSVADMASMVETIVAHYSDQRPEVAFAWAIKQTPVHTALTKGGFFDLPDRIRPISINFGARGAAERDCHRARYESGWHLSYFDSDTV